MAKNTKKHTKNTKTRREYICMKCCRVCLSCLCLLVQPEPLLCFLALSMEDQTCPRVAVRCEGHNCGWAAI